ncbi:MAG TPA: Ig-like domain-containing protein [Burkholderiales bacterium]|nr:Ig-like domain-containing protein [Burkholderiales bacterium]
MKQRRQRARLLVEEVEPRILHSADAAALVPVPAAAQLVEVRVVDPAPALPAAEPIQTSESRRELVIVDGAVGDYQALVDALQAGRDTPLDVYVLDPAADGVRQIGEILAARRDVAAVHLVSHGSAGALELGSTVLDSAALQRDRDSIAAWRDALAADADFLIYGCDVASGAQGQAFVGALAALTGADVAASTDLTGSAARGGDWTLEYSAGRIDAAQLSAAAWQGTLANEAPSVTDRALAFDGTDSVVVATPATLVMTSTTTIEVTFQKTGPVAPTNEILVNKEGEYELGISGATGNLQWAFKSASPGWNWVDTGYNVTPDKWLHVAVAYNDGVVNTYVDGQLVHTDNGSGPIGDEYPGEDDFTIGSRQHASNQHFVGLIDEVRVWNVERSAAEVQANYRTSLAGNEADLAGYWRFDETSGTTAFDATANGNDGVLGNGIAADVPARTTNLDYTVAEDTPLVVAAPGVLQLASDAEGSAVTALLVTGPAHAAAFTLNADGSFSYTPTADYSGSDSFVFRASDGAAQSAPATVRLSVTAVNDAPTLTGTNDVGGINRNPTSNPGTLVADLIAGHMSDVDTGALGGIAVTAVDNTNGTWQYTTDGGASWAAFGSPAAAAARLLAADIATLVRFVPNTNYSGTVAGGLTFRAWDQTSGTAGATADASVGGGASAFSAAVVSGSISVSASNTAPTLTGSNALSSIDEDAVSNAGTLVSALISGMADDVDPGAVTGIAVTNVDNADGAWQYSVNAGSTWTNFGAPSAAAARLLAADANTYVRFVPNADWNGAVAGGITFRAWDRTSGVAGATADTSGLSATFRDNFGTVSYTNNDGTQAWAGAWVENDSAGGAAGGGRFRIAGGVLSLQVAQAGDFLYRSADLSGAAGATLSFNYQNNLGGAARLDVQVSGNGGASYTTVAGGAFDTSNAGAGSRTIDIGAYIAADTRVRLLVVSGETGAGVNAFSLDNLQIQAIGSNGGSTAFSTATAAAAIAVNAVNDAPARTAGAVNNLTMIEDSAPASLGLGALAYGTGAADESAQTLTYTVTAVPAPALGTLTLADGVTAVTASTTYTLAQLRGMQFAPAANASGGPAAFSWTVTDSGGTAAGGSDTLSESLTITVTAANDAPALSGTNDLSGINRNPTSNPGTLVADLTAGHLSDIDSAALGVAVTAVDNTNGTWEFSTNGGSTWTAFGSPAAATARLLAADISTYVRFVPNADWSGTVAGGLTFKGWDGTSGAAGATADASVGGGATAFSAASATASITVSAANTAPVLNGSNNLGAINEDATGSAGTLVSALIAAMTTDADPASLTGIAVTAVDNTNGTWQYSVNAGGAWTSFGSPSATTARLLAADASTYVRFVPNANWNGTVANGITFRAWDRTSGVAGGTADTSGTAGTFRDEFQTASYSNSNGTLAWSGPWVETDSGGGGASGGNIRIGSGLLTMDAAVSGNNIYREVDLSGSTGATLSFTYFNGLQNAARFEVQVSSNGGASYTTLAGGVFDESTNKFIGTRTFDISAFISAQTRVRWLVTGTDPSDNTLALTELQIAGTANSGGSTAFSTGTASASVAVNAVNDAPMRTAGAILPLAPYEDAAPTSLGLGALAYSAGGGADEAVQTLTYTVTAVPAAALGTVTLADGTTAVTASTAYTLAQLQGMQFRAAANANGGPTTLSWTVADSGGTANGGVDTLAQSLTIVVVPVNDAPAGADKTVTVLEDAAYTFTTADFGFSDALDGDALAGVRIGAVPAAGTLTLSGTAVTTGQTVTAASITAGNLRFTPAPGANGAAYASFTFQVQDDGGTAFGGVNLDPVARTMTVDVTSVNDAPTGTNKTVTIVEDAVHTFAVADFGYGDADGDAFANVKIASLPGAGSLTFQGVTVTANQLVSAASIAAGDLKFAPAPDAKGAAYAAFTFQVQDDGGTASGGADLDATPRTMTVAVTSVNDAPAGTSKTITMLEDGAYTFSAADFGFGDAADGDALSAVRIAATPVAGALTLSGVAVTAGQSISIASITAGNLRFAPAQNANGAGYASFTFQVQDDGGTADGGVDVDPVARTMTVDVVSVNDAPTGTNKTVTTFEDTAYTFTVADFGYGDADGDAFSNVKIATVPGAGSLTLQGVALTANQFVSAASIAAGDLKFTPAPDGNGALYASFTFQVQDDGGTTNGGADLDATPPTMTVAVTSVNDAPSGTGTTVIAREDTPYVFVLADFGFGDAGDGDALLAVNVGALPAAGTLTLSGVAVTSGQSIAAADIAAGSLRYSAAPNANGAAYASFTFSVQDDGGTADGGIDTDPLAHTLTIDVAAVNDAPAGSDHTVTTLEDTAYVFSAADFGFGDAVEANALLAVRIESIPGAGSLSLSGAAVTSGQTVSAADLASGNLRYTPAPDANGAAHASFAFRVQDDGGTSNGGADLDPLARTLTIDVVAVNDAPAGADRTVTTLEDTRYTFTAADFGFVDAADGDAFAGVRVAGVPAAGSLTLAGVAVAANQFVSAASIAAGDLVYTPAANANGAAHASFAFRVQDDGGTAAGGADTDATARTMTIAVTPVNDAPSAASSTVTTLEDTPYTFTVLDFGFTDEADAAGSAGANALAAVRISSLPLTGTLVNDFVPLAAGDVISAADIAAGKLMYMPALDGSGGGYASFAFEVRDDGGIANGGADVDANLRTMTIGVTAVNDAPSGADRTVTTLEDTAYVFAAGDFGFSDAADGNAFAGVRIASTPLAGTLTLHGVAVTPNQLVSAASIAAGDLVYTPAADANGAAYASFAFRVQDDGGTLSGGADTDAIARTLTIAVTAVNDAPTGADNTVTTLEDTPYRYTPADFGFADARDGNAFAAVRIVTPPGSGSLTLAGVAVSAGQVIPAASIAAGDLVYAPPANANGASQASFTFQVGDDGGVAAGGVDFDIVARTMTVDVTPVNDAPAGADARIAINEGGAYTFAAADFGYADAADSPANALAGVRITAVTGSGTLLLGGAAVGAGEVVPVARIAAGELTFSPGASGSGAAYAAIAFRVQDDGGTSSGGVDTDAAARTLTIDVMRKSAAVVVDPVASVPPPPPPPPPPAPTTAAAETGAEQASSESRNKTTLARIAAELDAAAAQALKLPMVDTGGEVIAPVRGETRADAVASSAPSSSAARRDGAAATAVAAPIVLDLHADSAAPAQVLPTVGIGARHAAASTAADATDSSAREDDAKRQAHALLTLENGVRASAIIVSVGAVGWTLHGAGLLASLLTSAPAWRHLDPLPVLAPESEKPDWGDGDGDSQREEDAADRLWLDAGRSTARTL